MPPTPSRHTPSRRTDGERGQSLVEFSLILGPLLLLLLGIIQFGFVFNTYVTVSTAAREGARTGSIYQYDRTITQSANDLARNNEIRSQTIAALNGLVKTAPNFTTSSTWTTTVSGTTTTFTNGDLVITYALPTTVTANDPRVGYRVTVKLTYHQDLYVPIIGSFLPQDAGGRLPLGGEVTMSIN
ncbi:MAG TPA: TadE/TadG family type IV pilus assembly protein [Candidatus Limnocylindrales bacterium]|nr:TadE/TadG family type IV pilus assembly protein [Candidatus Limnocylindrales bacterium]